MKSKYKLRNSINYSPLRYPGGKSCLSNYISELVQINNLGQGCYVELYAGGAGAAFNLLFDDVFSSIHINDYDYNIYAMWYSILNHSKAFINKINKVDVTIEEWYRQKEIYNRGRKENIINLGFATFFLNRTNRSGIIYKAGPIGGINQSGNYKIDVRFNKEALIERIKKIAKRRGDVTLTNHDAVNVLENIQNFYPRLNDLFIYLDPPYYKKGKKLYLNNYDHQNHQMLSNTINKLNNLKWMISYDNVVEIKKMYGNYRMTSFNLNYSLQTKKFGSELLIFCDDLTLPHSITIKNRRDELILLND